jgi:hypothetical protein
VEYFSYFVRVITDGAGCARESKFRIVLTKAAFNRKKCVSPANYILIAGTN